MLLEVHALDEYKRPSGALMGLLRVAIAASSLCQDEITSPVLLIIVPRCLDTVYSTTYTIYRPPFFCSPSPGGAPPPACSPRRCTPVQSGLGGLYSMGVSIHIKRGTFLSTISSGERGTEDPMVVRRKNL